MLLALAEFSRSFPGLKRLALCVATARALALSNVTARGILGVPIFAFLGE